MSTRRAIGWYEVDATTAEKIKALERCIVDAAVELGSLGVGDARIVDVLDEAILEAENARWEAGTEA
jgi:hypothetical protein